MQSESNDLVSFFLNTVNYEKPVSRRFCFWTSILLTFGAGCGQSVSTVKTTQEPYKAKSLTVCCYPSVDPRPIRQFAEEWSVLKGADIHVSTECVPAAVPDVVIVSSADLPGLAETGRFLPVAPAILERDHFYQWDGLLRNYSGLLAVWNGVAYGVPLLGEGYVMVYRKDRFAEANLKKPPENWEDFVDAAKQLAVSGRPSLPALPSSPLGLETEFHLIASCYDRSTLQQGEIGNQIPDEAKADLLYSYHYRLKTGEPRINAPPFVEAFELLRRMRPYRAPAKADPLTDLLDGNASLAIVDLKDLARLQHDPASKIRGKFGVAKLPGARFTFDLDGKKSPTRATDVNRTPYLGYGSWMGLVSKTCAHPDMAFEFLAGFADPEQTGAEMITSAKYGAGPLRPAQIEERARSLWFGYDLTAPDTEAMISALKQSVASSVVNTRYRLRLPNRQQHLDEFDQIVRPALEANESKANETPGQFAQETLDKVADAWKKRWNGVPEETKKAWIKHNYGL
jgi:multiple sugar transport system substrate-binding protein